MGPNTDINSKNNPKIKERIFFLCEDCMWGVTSIDKSHIFKVIGDDYVCPACHQDQLSSFPIMSNESFTYRHSENGSIKVKFNNGRAIKKISQI
jgi:hypothetical protein